MDSHKQLNYIKFTVNNTQLDMNSNYEGNNTYIIEYGKWVAIQQYLIRSIYIMLINHIDSLFDDEFSNIFKTYLKPYSNNINIGKFDAKFEYNNVNENILPDNELTRFNCIEYIGYTNYNRLMTEYLHDNYIYGKFKKLNEYQKCIMHLKTIYPYVNNVDHILKITHNNYYGSNNYENINDISLNIDYLKENYMDISQDFTNSFELDDYLLSLLVILGIYPDRYKYIGYSREFIRLSYYQIHNIHELFKIPYNYKQFNNGKIKYSSFNEEFEQLHSFISRYSNLSDSEFSFTAQLLNY